MKDNLAEKLLAKVLSWTEEDIARERPVLQAMAAYKYDQYQQFLPGMRFVESLAQWLSQFAEQEQRETAYRFVRERLIFFSAAEIGHYVTTAYPDHIRPILFDAIAHAAGLNKRQVRLIAQHPSYQVLRRQCLFLGLSDGARTDIFRRANPQLSNEQVWQAYEMPDEKAGDVVKELRGDLANLLGRAPTDDEAKFRFVFLLDDFSASGVSYLRKEGEYKGKIAKFMRHLGGSLREVVTPDVRICIVLYVATEKAISVLTENLRDFRTDHNVDVSLHVVHVLPNSMVVNASRDSALMQIIQNDDFYDPSVEDKHTKKGGTNVKLGFNECALPVVLHHNTPNNSIFLLWSTSNKIVGLFPRVMRHREQ